MSVYYINESLEIVKIPHTDELNNLEKYSDDTWIQVKQVKYLNAKIVRKRLQNYLKNPIKLEKDYITLNKILLQEISLAYFQK